MVRRHAVRTAGVVIAVMSAFATAMTANTTSDAAPWCGTDSLSLTTGPYGAPGDASQIHFDITLTNTSPESCALQGYPGVDLIGPDDPSWAPFTACRGKTATLRPSPWLPGRRPAVASPSCRRPAAGCPPPSW